jgi:microcystin degradation protein MlrC
MRIFTASLATETNTFAPLPTGLASYRERGYHPAGRHPDHLTFFAAPLWALRLRAAERGWTVIEGMVAAAQPGGLTTREAWTTLRDELLADLRAAMPVDVVVLGLHGAMVADGCDDCEGELLTKVREIVGPDAVVGAELDPHHHLTPAKVTMADVLVAFKEYPHVDMLERAHELLDLCVGKAEGRTRPVAAVADCGAVFMMHTTQQPARGFIDRIQAMEGRDGVLSISVAQGFPWGDVPEMGSRVLVYTDGDADGAQRLARSLADELYALRGQLGAKTLGIDAALDAALAEPAGPVVLADGADNPGGGGAGDSTFVLRRMVERGIAGAALGPLWDPAAVRIAFEAGEGARLAMRLGGKTGPMSGDPLDARVTVRALRRDMRMTGLGGTPMGLGDCALLGVEPGIDVVVVSQRQQAMGTDLFTGLGCDPASKRIVVVKSQQHFRAAFGPIAARVIHVDAPGSVTGDLRSLPYRKARRTIWPLNT